MEASSLAYNMGEGDIVGALGGLVVQQSFMVLVYQNAQ